MCALGPCSHLLPDNSRSKLGRDPPRQDSATSYASGTPWMMVHRPRFSSPFCASVLPSVGCSS